MTRTAVLRQPLRADGPETLETLRAGLRWRCTPAFETTLEAGRVDWHALEAAGGTVVKHNRHRDVWRLAIDGRDYFVKHYRHGALVMRIKALWRGTPAEQEWRVGHYAARFGVAAVGPVACGQSGRFDPRSESYLVTPAVPGAVPLNDFWLTIRHSPREARRMAVEVARLVARAHQCGFRHLDMHAGNLLVQTAQTPRPMPLYVDLHNVRIGRPVNLEQVVSNLAQLNQWFRRHATRTQRLRFLLAYLAARDEFAQASPFARNHTVDPRKLLGVLSEAASRHANELLAKRDRRSLRDGRYFTRLRLPGGWRGHAVLAVKHPVPGSRLAGFELSAEQWRDWLADPNAWIDGPGVTPLKDSHSGLVCRGELSLAGRPLPVVCKRPRPRTLVKRLLYSLGLSRNMRSWRRAHSLIHRDLPTAQPLAVIEKRWAKLFLTDSLLMTELVEPATDLEAFIVREIGRLPVAGQRAMKDRLIASVCRLLCELAERGFAHRDFKAPNVMVRRVCGLECPIQLALIDMDGITLRRRPQPAAADRALVRLGVSLSGCHLVTRTDRLRALREYLPATGRLTNEWKRYWRLFDAQSRRKLHDKEQRRLWKLARYGRE